ncbi:MAG: hypothetical protein QE164_05430 [Candidatus Nezhaarchaeota archaeon]|nr:hypothetical protein [Candidatus Nezhaarchaeota archaeon]
MRVLVEFLGEVGRLTGKTITWIELPEEASLLTLFHRISDFFGKDVYEKMFYKFLEKQLFVFVNGISIDKLEYKLKDMDRIIFTTLAYGG